MTKSKKDQMKEETNMSDREKRQAPEAEAAAARQSDTPDSAGESAPQEAAADEAAEPSEAEILRQAILDGDFDINDFLSQFKEAQAAKDEADAKVMRLQADFENLRRRSKMDTEAAIHRAAADLIGSILPVVDNFDRAWQAMAEGPDKEGVALIARQLLDVLRNAGLTEIQAEGMDFDPNLHHAVSQADAGPEMKGKVIMVLQKGYLLHDKLLRAPMVQVGI